MVVKERELNSAEIMAIRKATLPKGKKVKVLPIIKYRG